MGTLGFGGVFERHPDLRVVCVEADAGWVPHYIYRMDHAYKRHRNWLQPGVALSTLPSENFAEHIFVTFQNDWTAFSHANDMNWRRLMWANDFPHSDSDLAVVAGHARRTDGAADRGADAGDPLGQRRRPVRHRRHRIAAHGRVTPCLERGLIW